MLRKVFVLLKVKLVHDYTKYNDKLEKGVEGFALETPEEQMARKSDDRFVKVRFEGITDVDVLWRGLEIIDTEYLNQKQAEKDAYFLQMKSAENVVYTLGPKGGFKSLDFDYVDSNGDKQHLLIEDKVVGQDYLDAFEKYGVQMQTIQLEKKIPVRKSKKN